MLANAASSALRSTAQLYRARYGGPGLAAAALVPILDRAFMVLADGGRQLQPPGR